MTPRPVASWPLPRCLVPSPPPAPRRGGAGDKLGAEVLGGRQTTSVGAEGRERSSEWAPLCRPRSKPGGENKVPSGKTKCAKVLQMRTCGAVKRFPVTASYTDSISVGSEATRAEAKLPRSGKPR